MPDQAYRIIKWHERHENAESRKVKSALDWVRIPTAHDSLGLKRLLGSKRGVSAFGAYILFVEVAAKCPKRGVLANSDGALTLDDIAQKTGAPLRDLVEAMEVLSEARIGWIDKIPWPESATDANPTDSRANRAEQVSETRPAGIDRDRRIREESEPDPEAVGVAVASLEAWSNAARGNGLSASEAAEATRRLNAMPAAAVMLPEAVSHCRRTGVKFKSIAYVFTPLLGFIDDRKGASGSAPVLTPEAAWNRCKTSITFAGVTVPRRELAWDRAAILRNKKPWIPADRLAEAVIA